MSNSGQNNGASGSASNNDNSSNKTEQPRVPPMVRPSVPEHIREYLRASLYSRPPVQRPPPNYHNALHTMTRTIQNQYAQPSQSHVEYGQRQTRLAEYGFPQPNITPPQTPTQPTTGPMIIPSGYEQQVATPLSRPNIATAPAPTSTQPALRQQSITELAEEAEHKAFNINPATGLNDFGMLCGYMPVNVVDRIPGAWDPSGKMLWLPKAMREEEQRKGGE